MSDPRTRGYHFYGRRKGHRLSPTQAALLKDLLPRVELPQDGPVDPADLFPERRDFWLEIGFGGAEHLIWQAQQNPQAGIIGVEPFINGIVKALSGIRDQSLENVRLYGDDVRDLLPRIADASLDRVFILFPDPWPKLRHRRRRIVQPEMVDALARLLKPGSELRMASDIDDYVEDMLQHVTANPAFQWTAAHLDACRTRPADWPQTRYEAKALREGRVPTYLQFVRRSEP